MFHSFVVEPISLLGVDIVTSVVDGNSKVFLFLGTQSIETIAVLFIIVKFFVI